MELTNYQYLFFLIIAVWKLWRQSVDFGRFAGYYKLMKRYVCLNKQLDAQQLLNIMGEMINKTNEMPDRVLVLEIKSVSQHSIMLPLLEHKESYDA